MLPPILRILVPFLVLGVAPAAQAAWLPPLKPSAARKKPPKKAVAASAKPVARATARPSPRPTPTPTPMPALPAAPEEDLAADPTPDVVHPAFRADLWRATSSGAAYAQVLEVEGTLWQGPWGLGARALGIQDPAALGALGAGGVPVAVTLRRRFGDAPGPTLTGEVGWHSALGPVGMGLVGLHGSFPVRWLTVEGEVRTAGSPPTDAWLVDATLGIGGRLGPVGLGLGWRHMAFGRCGRGCSSEQLTGPYVSGRLGF